MASLSRQRPECSASDGCTVAHCSPLAGNIFRYGSGQIGHVMAWPASAPPDILAAPASAESARLLHRPAPQRPRPPMSRAGSPEWALDVVPPQR